MLTFHHVTCHISNFFNFYSIITVYIFSLLCFTMVQQLRQGMQYVIHSYTKKTVYTVLI